MLTPRDVAALYVDPRGPYPGLGVECWDESHDARWYGGPGAIVAHPPCGAWGQLRHKYKGDDRDCAIYAVAQVRYWGGVLEHPRGSLLWGYASLPLPGAPADAWGGRAYSVEQVAWGHACRKPTWLYVVGVPDAIVRAGIRTGGEPTHQIWGNRGNPRHRADLKGASAQIRRRTPPAFAQWLIDLARQAAPC